MNYPRTNDKILDRSKRRLPKKLAIVQQHAVRIENAWFSRSHRNVAVVALANKMARIVWSVMTSRRPFVVAKA